MAEKNADERPNRRIEFRIGIHVGDIIIDENDIFGDGVNIAARLEGIAEPGGICVSDDAQRQIRGKVDITFDDLGPQTLKNIAELMRAWRCRIDAAAPEPTPSKAPQTPEATETHSIAVLPFQNMSGDPGQEYFSDGLTEDLITTLTYWRSFPIIARNSCVAYKGKAVDVKQIARDLRAAYILEGSVRKAGARVRITAQLIDGLHGHHLWAEKYDSELNDIFEVQDDIVQRIAAAVAPQLDKAELQRSTGKQPQDSRPGLFVCPATGKRDTTAALKFLKRIMEKYWRPGRVVTDRPCSYGAAMKDIGIANGDEFGRRLNNRGEKSHQPFRRQERTMQRFRGMKTSQKFSSVFAQIHNHLNPQRQGGK